MGGERLHRWLFADPPDERDALLSVGRIDEIQLNLVPVLLGNGVRLFDRLGAGPAELEQLTVVPTTTVTHLRYRVRRKPELRSGDLLSRSLRRPSCGLSEPA